jgi:hypothetical protein
MHLSAIVIWVAVANGYPPDMATLTLFVDFDDGLSLALYWLLEQHFCNVFIGFAKLIEETPYSRRYRLYRTP